MSWPEFLSRVVRPKLEETKSKLPELSEEDWDLESSKSTCSNSDVCQREDMEKYGIQDVEDIHVAPLNC